MQGSADIDNREATAFLAALEAVDVAETAIYLWHRGELVLGDALGLLSHAGGLATRAHLEHAWTFLERRRGAA